MREWNSINWISVFINAALTSSDLLSSSSQIEWKGSKSYNTSFREDNKKTFPASELQRKVSGLTPDTEYEFQVSAKSSCGEGVSSNTARGTTAKDGEHRCPDCLVFDIFHLLQVIWWFDTQCFICTVRSKLSSGSSCRWASDQPVLLIEICSSHIIYCEHSTQKATILVANVLLPKGFLFEVCLRFL